MRDVEQSAAVVAEEDLSETVSRPKYEDLVAYFEAVESNNMEPQQKRNRASVLKRFLEAQGIELGDPVGQELGDGFESALATFSNKGQASGKKKTTLSNDRTWLRQWKACWESFVATKAVPQFENFFEAFYYYFDQAKKRGSVITYQALSVLVGRSKTYFTLIKSSKSYPKHVAISHAKCAELENALALPPGTLVKHLSQEGPDFRNRERMNRNSTEYSKKIALLKDQPYLLADFPRALKTDIIRLVRFKTALSVVPLKRNRTWRLAPKNRYIGNPLHFSACSTDPKTFCPTAHKNNQELRRFFGFLKLEGMDPENFSLAYVTDFFLVRRYVDFMHQRHENKVTHTVLDFINFCRGQLHPLGGFVRQHPELAGRLPTPISSIEWETWCSKQDELFKAFQRELKQVGGVSKGRDTNEPIKNILDRDHPIEALFELAEAIERYLERYEYQPGGKTVINRISLERDLMVIRLLTEQPLRIKMLKIMEYRADNSGNLYKRGDGRWAIKFRPEDFKNERGAAQKPYDIPVSAELGKHISAYLEHTRPLFNDNRPNLFVSADTNGRVTEFSTNNLNKSFRIRTRVFLPECPGFGPHAVRHIVATDYIKNNPNGFQVAADVLHDKLETVLKHYAFLKAADGHKYYQAWLGDVRKAWSAGR